MNAVPHDRADEFSKNISGGRVFHGVGVLCHDFLIENIEVFADSSSVPVQLIFQRLQIRAVFAGHDGHDGDRLVRISLMDLVAES